MPRPSFLCPHPTIAVVLAAAWLAGCASTGGLQPQNTAVEIGSLQAQRSLAGIALDSGAWPQQDWWRTLGDPQLDALVDEALSANPDLALASARVRAALASANAADAERKPTLNAGASISGARIPPLLPPIASGHFGVIRYGYLSFKWNLDPWGGERDAWQAALGNARAAEVDARATHLKLSASVAQAYFNLGGAHAQRELTLAELKRAENFLALTQQRVTAGIESKFKLSRISGETAADRAQLSASEHDLRIAGIVLATLLGRGPDKALDIKPPPQVRSAKLVLPSDLPAELLGRRPDVVAARWRVEAAGKDIRAASAQFLPNINIGALAGLIAPSSGNLLSLASRFYQLAPAISLPIFEGGKLRANLAGKEAVFDAAVAQYDKTVIGAINQVAAQSDSVRALDTQLVDARQARDSAATAYRYATQRYRGGVGNFLEALSVRQQLIAAERELAAIETQRGVAWVELVEALGGGFKPAGDEPALVAAHDRARIDKGHP